MHHILCDNATIMSRVITDDESWICSYDPETKQQSSQWRRPNSPRQVKSKVNSMFIIFFFQLRGLSTKNLSWQAILSIPNTTVMFYGDYVKMGEDSAPNSAPSHTSSFTSKFFTKNNVTVASYPPYLPDFDPCDFSVSLIED
jgi:hypothetical protein